MIFLVCQGVLKEVKVLVKLANCQPMGFKFNRPAFNRPEYTVVYSAAFPFQEGCRPHAADQKLF